MRAFIAVNLPAEFKEEIIILQNRINKDFWRGKLTEPENIHLTLKFLGEISQEKMVKVKELLEKVRMSPQKIIMEQVGLFKRNSSPAIIWVKIRGLEKLQEKIDDVLKYKFEKEKRFMSHITIARVKLVTNKKNFENLIRGSKIRPLESQVIEFKLLMSDLSKGKPEYSTLKTYPLY